MHVDGSGNIVVQITGDHNSVNIQNNPYLTLVRAQTRVAQAKESPSDSILSLLSPYRLDLIPLVARAADLASMEAWLRSPAPAISVRTIAGRAGAGKTRFAAEVLTRYCGNTGEWLGGFLTADHLASFVAQHNFAAWKWPKPVLAVMDYASASVTHLQKWLRALADLPLPPDTPPLRILLLDRYASDKDGWFRTLAESNPDRPGFAGMLESREPMTLTPLSGGAQRRDLLAAMLDAAAHHRNVSAPPLPDDAALLQRLEGEELWADPLYLLMAAITGLDTGVPQALARSRTDLAHHLARGERTRLDRFGPSDESACRLRIHVTAVATLTGGLSQTEAREESAAAVSALGLAYAGGSGQCAADLGRALHGDRHAIASIAPDIVGEAFVLDSFAGEFREDGDRAVQRLGRRALPVLIRAAQDFSTPVQIGHVSAPHPAPLEWLEQLIRRGEADDLGLLAEIDSAMPDETVALRELACRVTREIYQRVRSLDIDPEAKSARLGHRANNWSLRLGALGRREEALAAAEEAVRLYRQLAAARPDALLPDLAGSLNNVGNMLSELGRREEALAASEEAVHIRRQLAAARPHAFLPDLAGSLNNVGNRLSELGRRKEALATAEEAVRLYRQLAAARPDAFLPDLAGSLNNVGNMLSELGRREEALAASEEAVRLYRQLAAARPDAFLPDLAMSLGARGSILLDVSSSQAALASFHEGIQLLSPQFLQQPRAFARLIAGLAQGYLQAAQATNTPPDTALLAPILEALQRLESQ